MTVYVLMGSWDYEGDAIVSIHTTREGAEEAQGNATGHDSYSIEEHEVKQ